MNNASVMPTWLDKLARRVLDQAIEDLLMSRMALWDRAQADDRVWTERDQATFRQLKYELETAVSQLQHLRAHVVEPTKAAADPLPEWETRWKEQADRLRGQRFPWLPQQADTKHPHKEESL